MCTRDRFARAYFERYVLERRQIEALAVVEADVAEFYLTREAFQFHRSGAVAHLDLFVHDLEDAR